MASKKAHRRFVVDLKAREKAYGQIYAWLYRRHEKTLALVQKGTPNLWDATASIMAAQGVCSKSGSPPTRNAVQIAWLKVTKHIADDARRQSEDISTNTAKVSRRHKGWVPTSRDPVPSDRPASQSATPPTRTPAPPPPHAAPPPPAPTAPVASTMSNEGLPLGHPDHPLGPLTDLEVERLARYANAPVEVQQRVLNTYRDMRHMDRFSRPGWQ